MNEQFVVHPTVKRQLGAYAASPSHAVLLVGPKGVGKGGLAANLAANVLGIEETTLSDYPYLHRVFPEKEGSAISIESIRALQKFLQLKTIGSRPIRRIVTIEGAEALTTEAQNAFLKLLEEPPADTVLILTTANQRALLSTILSRTQVIPIHPPGEVAVKKYFIEKGYKAAAITQAFFLSGGLPGLMSALLASTEHPMIQSIAAAKDLLQKSPFERLAAVESLSKQKDEAGQVIEALITVAKAMVAQGADRGEPAKIKQWHHILKVAQQAQDGLLQNGNAKLVLTNTMLQM